MDKLELEWKTFDFYTAKIQKQESVHFSKMNLIQSFLSKNYSFTDHKKTDLLRDYNGCCRTLLLLYKKQMDSLSNLIKLNRDIVDIPIEREVSTQNLIELMNTTATLMEQIKKHQEEMKALLDSDEDNL